MASVVSPTSFAMLFAAFTKAVRIDLVRDLEAVVFALAEPQAGRVISGPAIFGREGCLLMAASTPRAFAAFTKAGRIDLVREAVVFALAEPQAGRVISGPAIFGREGCLLMAASTPRAFAAFTKAGRIDLVREAVVFALAEPQAGRVLSGPAILGREGGLLIAALTPRAATAICVFVESSVAL